MNTSARLTVGVGRAIVERHRAVLVSRQKDTQPQPAFDHRPQPARDLERDVFFQPSARASRAVLVTAVAWIDDDASAMPVLKPVVAVGQRASVELEVG